MSERVRETRVVRVVDAGDVHEYRPTVHVVQIVEHRHTNKARADEYQLRWRTTCLNGGEITDEMRVPQWNESGAYASLGKARQRGGELVEILARKNARATYDWHADAWTGPPPLQPYKGKYSAVTS